LTPLISNSITYHKPAGEDLDLRYSQSSPCSWFCNSVDLTQFHLAMKHKKINRIFSHWNHVWINCLSMKLCWTRKISFWENIKNSEISKQKEGLKGRLLRNLQMKVFKLKQWNNIILHNKIKTLGLTSNQKRWVMIIHVEDLQKKAFRLQKMFNLKCLRLKMDCKNLKMLFTINLWKEIIKKILKNRQFFRIRQQ